MSIETTVIVGAGQAGGDLAMALRQKGFTGRIVLVGEEPLPPYRRPPLSKAYLSGEMPTEALFIRPLEVYEKKNIELRLSQTVSAIDRTAKTITLGGGEVLVYTKLVLATGGKPRALTIAGAELSNIFYVRTVADIDKIRQQFQEGSRLVIIGGGYIGLEAAAVGVKHGLQVTVVEAMPRLLSRVTSPEMSDYYAQVHRQQGVDVKLGIGIQAFEGQAHVEQVLLEDGLRLAADLVIVGIGLVPSTGLAEQAGLDVDNGIIVNTHGETSDPDIYAIGDCANQKNGFYQRYLRIESVPNATEQASVVASNIVGDRIGLASVPWFWSDQYHLKLQMVGLSQGYEQVVVRGSMASDGFSTFYLRDNVVIAIDTVNRASDFISGKKLVAERVQVDLNVLADESISLKSLLEVHRAS